MDHIVNPVDVLVDLCWGSCGKGKFAPLLASRFGYGIVATANGPNAGHTRVTKNERQIFKVLPSASGRAPVAALCPTSVFSLQRLYAEAGLSPVVMIHEGARTLLETDADEEAKSAWARFGSTCQGTALPMIRRITRDGAGRIGNISEKLPHNVEVVSSEVWHDVLARTTILFEGAQGTELSVDWGEFPYTTSRNCTTAAALDSLGVSPRRLRRVYGLLRAHPIRVGDPVGGFSGNLPNETTWKKILEDSGAPADYPIERLELTTVTKRLRKVGNIDLIKLRRACVLNGVTDLIINFVQYIDWAAEGVTKWNLLPKRVLEFIHGVEDVTNIPVVSVGTSETTECWNSEI